jgi:hypothetical protein
LPFKGFSGFGFGFQRIEKKKLTDIGFSWLFKGLDILVFPDME